MDVQRKNTKLNINHIAELAQVSKGTVSKVLNGQKGVGDPTRERILKLVKQLNYHQDASARALALQRTGIIGFLIPHTAPFTLSSFFWSGMLSGISQQAAKAGYNVLVLTPSQEGNNREVLLQTLNRGTVDGFIIGSELLDKESFSTLILDKVPFVLLGQNPEFQHYCVDDDSIQGTRLLIEHMIRQGYRKIGTLLGPRQYTYVQERLASYRACLEAHGIDWQAVAYSTYSCEPTMAAVEKMLDDHPDMDALFVGAGGEFLLDSMNVLRRRGKQFPQFGLGVFDDYPYLDYLSPRVTAIRQPLQDAGARSIDMLLSLIAGVAPEPALNHLPCQLVLRDSCGENLPPR